MTVTTEPTIANETAKLPPTLADEISKLDPLAIAKDSGTTEGEVRTRLARLVQKTNNTEDDIKLGKHKERADICFDDGIIKMSTVDAQVILMLEKQLGATKGFDPSLERTYKEITGEIQSVFQAKQIAGRTITDNKGDVWRPVIGFHRSFETSAVGNMEQKPGVLVKSLSYCRVPNSQPAKTP